MWVVRLEDERFLPVEYRLTPLVSDTRLPPLAVEKGAWIDVRLVSDAGAPVGGGIVRGKMSVPGGEKGWVRAEALSPTDEQGWARIPARIDEGYEIKAFSDGLQVRRANVVAPAKLSLALRRGESATVTVRDSSGRALEGAILQHQNGWPIGTTGTDGKLRIPLPPSAPIDIEVLTHRGGAGVRKIAEAGHVAVEVETPRLVKGRVVDRKSREAIEGALVWVKDAPQGFAVAGRGGDYELIGEPGARMMASGPGYVTASETSPPGTLEGAEAVRGPTFGLEPAESVIRGTVVDPQGNGVPDAEVVAAGAFGIENARISFTTVDGAFGLNRLAARKEIRVTAAHPDYADATLLVSNLEYGGTVDGLTLTLGRLRGAYGQVMSEALRPLPQVKVSAYRSRNHPVSQASSDSEGNFALGKLPPGRVRIELEAEGFARESKIIDMPSGEGAFDIGRILLEPEARLRGRIVDDDGQPVRGVEVFLERASGGRVTDATGRPAGDSHAVSDEQGQFEVPGLHDGEVVGLETWHEDFLPTKLGGVEVQSGGELELVLDRGLALQGQVEDEDGEPVEGAWISLAEEGSRAPMGFGDRTTYSDERGVFAFKRVGAGSVSLTVVAEGFAVEEVHGVQLGSEGSSEEVRVVLERGAVIEGRVLEPDGNPAIGASVGVVQEDGGFSLASQWGSDRTDGDGRFRLENIRLGQQSVSATHPEFAKVVEELTVGAGARWIELRFRRQRGFAVSGSVVDKGGAGVERLGLVLVPVGGGRAEATSTGPGGRFEFASVASGRYELSVGGSERRIPRRISTSPL